MKKIIVIFGFIILFSNISAQINKYGIPFITNYSADDYSSETQNWSVITDHRGVIYIGNNSGVLEYDGKNWRLIEIPNGSIVRSLAIDSAGTVFVGAFDEFGYLSPDEIGTMQYHSLTPLVDSLFQEFDDIWKIYSTPEAIYFGGMKFLFKYDYKNVTIVGNSYDKKGNLFFFMPDDNIFLGNYFEGLIKYNSDIYSSFLNSDFFAEKYITGIIKLENDKYLVSTYLNGIYSFDFNNGVDTLQTEFPKNTEKTLSQAIILSVSKIDENLYAFTTNSSGVIITNNKFEIIYSLSSNEKLIDNTVYSAKNNILSNTALWLATNNGISKVEVNSPFRFFDNSFGYEGSLIFDITEFKNRIYLATNVGVFVLDYDENNKPHFTKIEILSDNPVIEAWAFAHIEENGEEKLLIGTNFGIFYINEHSSKFLVVDNDVEKSKLAILSMSISKNNPNKLYLGQGRFFVVLEKVNNNWTIKQNIQIDKEVRSIFEDSRKNIWLGTHYSGIIKLDSLYNITEYGIEKGLPDLKDPNIYSFDNEMIISTPKRLYTYSSEKDSIILYSKSEQIISDKGYYKSTKNNNSIWFSTYTDKNESIIQIKNDSVISIPYKRPNFKGIQSIFIDHNGILWIGTPDAVYTYDTKFKKDYNANFNTLIRKVYLKNDSVLFNGTFYTNSDNDSILFPSTIQSSNLINELKFSENTIIFEWAATFYEDETANEFSYLLEGFDENWSKWSTETKYVFTNLPEGSYTFKVKSRNKYGIEGTTSSYQFIVLPPWYRTIAAFITYIIIALVIIFFVVKWYTRKLKRENIRLEKIVDERTKEIQLKNAELLQSNEEIEAQRDEIEAQRDVVLAKNQEIEEKNESINASIKYASRIQRAILPPTTPLSSNFSEYFILYKPRDIVSGDFYWLKQQDSKIYIVAADCTGHGVPGAFMSMLGVSLLNEITDKNQGIEAYEILNILRENVIKSLHQRQDHSTSQDGMDLSLIVFDKSTNEISYAGANNPLVLVRSKNNNIQPALEKLDKKSYKLMENDNANLVEIKADKMPIGIYVKDNISFKQHKFTAKKGDTMYIFSDGFSDQFGGPKGQKFMIKRLKQTFLDINNSNLNKQKEILETEFQKWINFPLKNSKETHSQIDDVIILAIRI